MAFSSSARRQRSHLRPRPSSRSARPKLSTMAHQSIMPFAPHPFAVVSSARALSVLLARGRRDAADGGRRSSAGARRRRRRRVTIVTLAAEADRAGLGIHRHAAIAALDDGPAGSRGHRHADLREVGRPRPRRHAAGPDQRRASSRPPCAAPRPTAPAPRPTSQYWRQQVKRLRVAASTPARSAGRSSIRRRTRCGPPRRGSAALDAQVSEGRVELRYYRVDAPQAGVVGDIPIRVGDRVTHLDGDHDHRRQRRRSRPTSRCRSIARRSCELGLPVQLLDADGKVVATNPITFVAPRVDDATQTVLVEERAQGTSRRRCASSSSCAPASSGARAPG